MTWDEWEGLKAEAAQGRSTRMRLNQRPADQGGGGGPSEDLRSDKKAWVTAGEGVTGLKADIGKALTALENGQAGLGDTTGCRSAAAQKELYDSWKKYIGDVSGRCGELGGLLEKSGHDLAKSDQSVLTDLDRLKVKYADTEAVGGRAPKEQ
ncbi:hypothetical protein SSPS47_17645 [Streptomyces sp. S4.7]|uniref:hypothetical protein n=1 Tax=Streptomyces sp. S4.7 TaxID=2705439 RepID=UPI0013994A3C|nr:hypothetical protein [Streptomyces sp. S4.7]QHY96933.1 hypothetical protein SSPS47_17645 [Streptomyces sp. S4.7]